MRIWQELLSGRRFLKAANSVAPGITATSKNDGTRGRGSVVHTSDSDIVE